jgi:hypothetical protein
VGPICEETLDAVPNKALQPASWLRERAAKLGFVRPLKDEEVSHEAMEGLASDRVGTVNCKFWSSREFLLPLRRAIR